MIARVFASPIPGGILSSTTTSRFYIPPTSSVPSAPLTGILIRPDAPSDIAVHSRAPWLLGNIDLLRPCLHLCGQLCSGSSEFCLFNAQFLYFLLSPDSFTLILDHCHPLLQFALHSLPLPLDPQSVSLLLTASSCVRSACSLSSFSRVWYISAVIMSCANLTICDALRMSVFFGGSGISREPFGAVWERVQA